MNLSKKGQMKKIDIHLKNHKVMIFVKKSEIYYFCSLLHFDHNIAKQLLWARGLDFSEKKSEQLALPIP